MIFRARKGVPVLLAEGCAVRVAVVCNVVLLRQLTPRTIVVTTKVLKDSCSVGVGGTSLDGSDVGSDGDIVRSPETGIIGVEDPVSRNSVVGSIRLLWICSNIDGTVSARTDINDLAFMEVAGRVLSPELWGDGRLGLGDGKWRTARVTDPDATSDHFPGLHISKVHDWICTPSTFGRLDTQSADGLGGCTGRHQRVLFATIRPNGEDAGIHSDNVAVEEDSHSYGLARLKNSIHGR